MITFGICLIYYGIALFLYQVYGWLSAGVWTPFPVSRAWEGFFGVPRLNTPLFDSLVIGFLTLPLGFTLLIGGISVLGLVFAARRFMERRRNSLRLKWMLEQCSAVGYKPWALPKVMRELDERLKNERVTASKRIG